MRILVVNANTTRSMTALIERCARAVAGPDVTVNAVTPAAGPASVECRYEEAMATPHVLAEIIAGEEQGYDGYVVACFGDPGLLAAREVARGPVVGIAEAGMRTATYLGESFSVVTTLARVVGPTQELARSYGLEDRLGGVHACEIPVVDLEADRLAFDRITAACREALRRDGSDVIVLGCAGMADLGAAVSAQLGVPVVEGVAAATLEVEKLVRLGLRTSEAGGFAPPPVKQYV